MRVLHLSAVRRLVDILEQEDCDASVMSTASTVSTLTSNTSSVGFLVLFFRASVCYDVRH